MWVTVQALPVAARPSKCARAIKNAKTLGLRIWNRKRTACHLLWLPALDRGTDVVYYTLAPTGGTTGGRAGSARASAHRLTTFTTFDTLAHGSKRGDRPSYMRATAFNTAHRVIGLAETSQELEFVPTIIAMVLIQRHGIHLIRPKRLLLSILPQFGFAVKSASG